MATKPDPTATGDTVFIASFSQESPTRCTVSPEDAAKLHDGDTVVLVLDPPNAAFDDVPFTVANLTATDFQLEGMDLSATDTTDLTAFATVTDTVPPEPADTTPNHQIASMSPGISVFHFPSPGVRGVPCDANPEDSLPGTSVDGEQTVPDPDAPLERRLTRDEWLERFPKPPPPQAPPEWADAIAKVERL